MDLIDLKTPEHYMKTVLVHRLVRSQIEKYERSSLLRAVRYGW